MLTLYIIPCDVKERHKPLRAISSVGDVATEIKVLKTRDLHLETEHKNEWFGYLYSDEVFSEAVLEALPVWLAHVRRWDYIVMFKKACDGKAFASPRIFGKHVTIAEGTLIPEGYEAMTCEKMLDGWIENDND